MHPSQEFEAMDGRIEFRTSMDAFARIVTAVILVAFAYELVTLVLLLEAGRGVTHHFFVVGVLLLILVYSYVVMPSCYSIENDELRIERPLNAKSIPLSSIVKVSRIKRFPGLRVLGIGGLFGYYGYYWFPKRAFGFVLARNGKNLLMIETTVGRPLLISPDDDTLLAYLVRPPANTGD